MSLKRFYATRKAKVTLLAILVGVPGLSYSAVELTSIPSFCNSCHEIGPAVESWRQSAHFTVKGKDRAGCRGCHVPAWSDPFSALWVKIRHGFKDIYHHYASAEARRSDDFYFRLKHVTLKDVTNEICLSCHADILRADKDVIKTEEGESIRGLHRSEEAAKLPCTMCHKNTGHGPYE